MEIHRGGVGPSIITVQCGLLATIADSTTYFLGGAGAPITSANFNKVYFPRAGTVTRIELSLFTFQTGSNEASTLYFRLNDTSDTVITTAIDNSTATTNYSLTGAAIAIAAGDYFELKWTTPAWATNPDFVYAWATVLIE